MATRPGVESFKSNFKPVTEKQKDFISEQIKLQPEIKDSFEYEDYITSPTTSNASELISAIAEKYVDDPLGLKNYVNYIAKRPRAERSEIGHGLWSGTNDEIFLPKISEEVANHKGNIYTHVISLRREDAERLGFDNASAWRDLVKSKLPIIAKSMNISMPDLKWYGAFHNEGNHPHIHLLVYSKDPKKGYLNKNGIETMCSAFGAAIFKNDLLHVYEQKDEQRKLINETASQKVAAIIKQIETREKELPVLAELLLTLSQELRNVKGKKVYGWLKGTPKLLVDNIAIELSQDSDIQELYKQWCNSKDVISKTYQKNPSLHSRLENETEFKSIKNCIIQYGKSIGEMNAEIPMPDVAKEIEAFSEDVWNDDMQPIPEETWNSDMQFFSEEAWDNHMQSASATNSGNKLSTIPQSSVSMDAEASKGNVYALYDIGMMYLCGFGLEVDTEKAHEYFEKALDGFKAVETKKHNDYIQYRIGKMYNIGYGTKKDTTEAANWFRLSSVQNNQFAQYSLGNLYYRGEGVEQSYEEAFKLYHGAFSQGNPFAAYELGKMYQKGIGTKIDVMQSQNCFTHAYHGFLKIEKMSDRGQIQYRLGQMCIAGQGTTINIPLAITFLEKAVESGNTHAMLSLMQLHIHKKADYIKIDNIVNALIVLAEQDDDFAQYALGYYYAFCADRNIEQAMFWLELSVQQGNTFAENLITYLKNPKYHITPTMAALNLFRNLGKIITDDFQLQQKHFEHTDKKLLKKIMQKKDALGQKQTFE